MIFTMASAMSVINMETHSAGSFFCLFFFIFSPFLVDLNTISLLIPKILREKN